MKRYLLDTNICVRFMRQKFGVDEHIEKVGWEHCCISEVTVAELLFGAERSNNVERNLQLVTDFCQDIKYLCPRLYVVMPGVRLPYIVKELPLRIWTYL